MVNHDCQCINDGPIVVRIRWLDGRTDVKRMYVPVGTYRNRSVPGPFVSKQRMKIDR